jgi:hypothetical protein
VRSLVEVSRASGMMRKTTKNPISALQSHVCSCWGFKSRTSTTFTFTLCRGRVVKWWNKLNVFVYYPTVLKLCYFCIAIMSGWSFNFFILSLICSNSLTECSKFACNLCLTRWAWTRRRSDEIKHMHLFSHSKRLHYTVQSSQDNLEGCGMAQWEIISFWD